MGFPGLSGPVQTASSDDNGFKKTFFPTDILPGKSHGQRILVGYSPWGHKESDTTERSSPEKGVCEVIEYLLKKKIDKWLFKITQSEWLTSKKDTNTKCYFAWVQRKGDPSTLLVGM